VICHPGLLQPAADGRYRFHDLVRLFATERFEDEDLPADRHATADRMRNWLLDVALTAGRWFGSGAAAAATDPDHMSLGRALAELGQRDEARAQFGAARALFLDLNDDEGAERAGSAISACGSAWSSASGAAYREREPRRSWKEPQ
jgi:hypothetical protein